MYSIMYMHLKLTDGVEKTISIYYMCIVFIDFQKHVYLHLTSLRKLSVFRSSPMNIRIIREYPYSTPLSILTHARNFFAKLRNKHEDLLWFVRKRSYYLLTGRKYIQWNILHYLKYCLLLNHRINKATNWCIHVILHKQYILKVRSNSFHL